MKRLDGREVAGYLQERHAGIVRSLGFVPKLAIIHDGGDESTTTYLKVKRRYGEEIGVEVLVHEASPKTIIDSLSDLNADPAITGIILQLPFGDAAGVSKLLDAIVPAKDVDGLGWASPFQPATPKAVLWLLAAYNIDLAGRRIAVVGQGLLVGRPLADSLQESGRDVARLDENTPSITDHLLEADIIVSATGQPDLITSEMVKPGAVIVDCGAPKPEVTESVRQRSDVMCTPNPGGVGPMTVAALFDNLLIAAQA